MKVLSKGYDCSAGHPTGAAAKAAGYTTAFRYLPKRGSSRVDVLDAAEYHDLTAHGVGVVPLYEDTSGARCGQGEAAGETDGAWALARAQEIMGDTESIIFCVDYDATPDAVLPYFRGTKAKVGLARNGAYGSKRVIDALYAAGLITWGFQTGAWSYGQVAAGIHMYQAIGYVSVGGVQCDADYVLAANHGQNPAPAPQKPSTPPTPPAEETEEMLIVKSTTSKGPYLLVSGAGVIAILDNKGTLGQLLAAGVKMAQFRDDDYDRLHAKV